MATIVLTSTSGSPGVTCTALGLALTWPRPVVLVDADPTGGSAILAGYFRGDVEHRGGLLDVALGNREGRLAEALPAAMMHIDGSNTQFLPGIRSHTQARNLTGLWEPLAGELAGLERNGQDVIVDAGRLGLQGYPEALLRSADLGLLLVRSNLPALAAARPWAVTLRDTFEALGGGSRLGVLSVGAGQPYHAREITRMLNLPVVGDIPFKPVEAQVLSQGEKKPRRFDSSAFVKALRAAHASITAAVQAGRDELSSPRVAGGSA